MARDFIKEGVTFALGLANISGRKFSSAVKKLEKEHKVSSKEGEKMVYSWIAEQQRQLEKMRKRMKKEALHTKIYSSADLARINRAVKDISKGIAVLEKKKKKAEKSKKGAAAKKKAKKAKKKK
jgi:hypothetical protein